MSHHRSSHPPSTSRPAGARSPGSPVSEASSDDSRPGRGESATARCLPYTETCLPPKLCHSLGELHEGSWLLDTCKKPRRGAGHSCLLQVPSWALSISSRMIAQLRFPSPSGCIQAMFHGREPQERCSSRFRAAARHDGSGSQDESFRGVDDMRTRERYFVP